MQGCWRTNPSSDTEELSAVVKGVGELNNDKSFDNKNIF